MSRHRDLTDRVICITGASSGIGRSTALAAARAGMQVAVSARRLDRLAALAREIESLGRRALPVACDVTRDDDVAALIDATMSHFGRLDAVLANAGHGHEAGIADMSASEWARLFEVNFFGTIRVIRAAVPIFRRQHSGHVLITSSALARLSVPYHGAYSATKAAQTQIGRALRLELEPDGIDVSVIHPVTTETEFFSPTSAIDGRKAAGSPERMPRWFVQSPEQVADAIVRCLRRPVAEVWMNRPVRFAAGLMVMFPFLFDLALRGEARRRRALNEGRRSER